MDKHLRDCPFCGGVPERGEDVLDGEMVFFISCRSCGARGGMTYTRESAAGLWDRRKGTPSKECVQPAHTFVGASVYLPGDDDSWICDFPDCGRVRAPGQRYCKMHRQREVRHGDPSIVMKAGRKKQAR